MSYISRLSEDKFLRKIINEHGPVELKKQPNLCLYLCFSIMSQQLSVKVARVIKQRFLDLYDGEPDSKQISLTPFEKLRGIGLSNAKASYVINVARFDLEHGINNETLEKMENEEVIEYLTRIKGVGRWTAEMMLMFALGREDVFAADDLGIQNAMVKLYKIKSPDKKKLRESILRRSEKWKPFRTYGCLYLWKSLG